MSSSVVNFLSKNANRETFLSSGTFTVPKGITQVMLWGYGAGGGGCGNYDRTNANSIKGSNGAIAYTRLVVVTEGASITVTVGAGGAGGLSSGSSGGNTSFGSLATFEGATGGLVYGSGVDAMIPYFSVAPSGVSGTSPAQGGYSALKGAGINPDYMACPAPNNGFIPTGSSSTSDNINLGRGGTGPLGVGGNGGSSPLVGSANTGSGGGSNEAASNGAAGGSGYLIVTW